MRVDRCAQILSVEQNSSIPGDLTYIVLRGRSTAAACSCRLHKSQSDHEDIFCSVAYGTRWQRTACTDSALGSSLARFSRDLGAQSHAIRHDAVRGTMSLTQVSQLKQLGIQGGGRWCAAGSSDDLASTVSYSPGTDTPPPFLWRSTVVCKQAATSPRSEAGQ